MTSPDRPTVGVVVVTYRSKGTIGACLDGLPDAGTSVSKVVIVDNASDDGTLDEVESWARRVAGRLSVEVVANEHNVGFGTAANQGVERLATDWVLLLNPDASCPAGTIDDLVAVAVSLERPGLVSPALRSADGALAPMIEADQTPGRLITHHLGLRRLRAWPAPDGGSPIDVEWVHGAALLLRERVATQLGPFDPDYFLYAEDMDLARRIRACGLTVTVAPDVVMDHIGGASAAMSGGEPVAARRRVSSQIRYLARHHGRAAARLVAVITAVGHALAGVLPGRRRDVHRAMAAGAAMALRRIGSIERASAELAVSS